MKISLGKSGMLWITVRKLISIPTLGLCGLYLL